MYLYPLIETDPVKAKSEKERVARELKELRNQMSFAFFLMNALFVVSIFVLTQNKERLNIPWPCGTGADGGSLQLEPIGKHNTIILRT